MSAAGPSQGVNRSPPGETARSAKGARMSVTVSAAPAARPGRAGVDRARALSLARDVLATEARRDHGARRAARRPVRRRRRADPAIAGAASSCPASASRVTSARKLAATLASTGTPAFFVHPTEASHGDLGMITPDDVVVMLSNSGETDELVLLTPHLKRQGAKLVALTGNEQSLARAGGRRASRRGGRRRGLSARSRADGEHDGGAGARRRARARAARRARLFGRGFRPLASGRHARPPTADARARRDAHRRRAAHRRCRRDAGGGRSSR